jgi:uracil-DNA glycosylase
VSIFLMEEQKQLDLLRQEAVNCYACSFGHTCTQKVFGEGPLGASLMSISEAPGASEDASGKPYQGRAGKFWEGMLASVGWSRDHIYVCNSLQCQPPQNKIPDGFVEINTCKHFLLKKIAIIKPKMILVFGKPAAFSLGILSKEDYAKPVKSRLGLQRDLYQYAGTDGRMYEARVMWSYHPSYLMSKPDGRAYCFEVYKQLAEARDALKSDLRI